MDNPVLIVGTGAMACLFAARLSAKEIPVWMLGTWRDGLEALRKNGVCVIENDKDEIFYEVQVIEEVQKSPKAKLALVLVKSWQTRDAAERLVGFLDPDGLALTLQNGLGNHEILVDVLGEDRVAVGVTTMGATLTGPGQVRPGGEGIIRLGNHQKIKWLVKLIEGAGFNVEITDNLPGLIWGKLVVNSAINPLTALLSVHNGVLLTEKSCRSLMGSVAVETTNVARTIHIPLPFEDPIVFVESVATRTAQNHSSMLQDLRRGAPTEIDAICGAIVQVGKSMGMNVSLNDTLLQLVKGAVNIRRRNLST